MSKQFRNSLICTGILALAALGEVREPLVCRWSPRDPGSTVVVRNGVKFFSLTSRGLTVEATVEDTGREILADVRIENRSEEPISIDPAAFGLELLSPKSKRLKFEVAEKVAERYTAPALNGMDNGATFQRTPPPSENAVAQREAERIRQTALRATSLVPYKAITGVVYFEREKKKQETMLFAPVGRMIFEFPFTWSGNRLVDAHTTVSESPGCP